MKARLDILGCGNFRVGPVAPITSWPMNEDERKAMIDGNKALVPATNLSQFGSLTSKPLQNLQSSNLQSSKLRKS